MTTATQKRRLDLAIECEHGQRRQAIVQRLLADVFQGKLRGGQHLVTQELSRRFGVSHTPIREALIAMEGMGIVDHLPNRGAVVRKVTSTDIREICEVRRILECQATMRACGRINLGELTRLAKNLKKLNAASSRGSAKYIEQARKVDSWLHDLIADSCNNLFLAKEIHRLKILFRAFRDVAWEMEEARNDYHRLAEESHEHLQIVEALIQGDAQGAAKAMSLHIKSGLRYWSRTVQATLRDSILDTSHTNGETKSVPRRKSTHKSNGKRKVSVPRSRTVRNAHSPRPTHRIRHAPMA